VIQSLIHCSHFGYKGICSQNESKVDKTLYSAQAKIFRERIRELREKAGLTQRQLAEKLGREHGMVARIEQGERRVDFVECYWLFKALGVDPVQEAEQLMTIIAASGG